MSKLPKLVNPRLMLWSSWWPNSSILLPTCTHSCPTLRPSLSQLLQPVLHLVLHLAVQSPSLVSDAVEGATGVLQGVAQPCPGVLCPVHYACLRVF